MQPTHPHRPRRLRNQAPLRRLMRETTLTRDDLVYPIFVTESGKTREPIASMPGQYRVPLAELGKEAREVQALGIPAIILFGVPDKKDAQGSSAWHENGVVQQAIRIVKEYAPQLCVMADTCLCQYTDTGHCGVVKGDKIDNDASVEILARTALSQAKAGADVIAPSDMMDGRIGSIRRILDDNGFGDTPILAYAAKYASSFYGPFRDAAHGAPKFGDRRSHQMDYGNAREALHELALDLQEGADVLMVKPALAYLDVIRQARERFDVPIAAYNVSGEYSMIKAAAERGWIDGQKLMLETLTAIKRAGADIILTYFAKEVAPLLPEPPKGVN